MDPPRESNTAFALVMIAGGVFSVLLGLFIAGPVAVNFPASWPGAVIAVGFFLAGVALIYRGIRKGPSLPK